MHLLINFFISLALAGSCYSHELDFSPVPFPYELTNLPVPSENQIDFLRDMDLWIFKNPVQVLNLTQIARENAVIRIELTCKWFNRDVRGTTINDLKRFRHWIADYNSMGTDCVRMKSFKSKRADLTAANPVQSCSIIIHGPMHGHHWSVTQPMPDSDIETVDFQ